MRYNLRKLKSRLNNVRIPRHYSAVYMIVALFTTAFVRAQNSESLKPLQLVILYGPGAITSLMAKGGNPNSSPSTTGAHVPLRSFRTQRNPSTRPTFCFRIAQANLMQRDVAKM
jgi:hypothetical protein